MCISDGVVELDVGGDNKGRGADGADVVGSVEVTVQEPEGAFDDLGVVLGVEV